MKNPTYNLKNEITQLTRLNDIKELLERYYADTIAEIEDRRELIAYNEYREPEREPDMIVTTYENFYLYEDGIYRNADGEPAGVEFPDEYEEDGE